MMKLIDDVWWYGCDICKSEDSLTTDLFKILHITGNPLIDICSVCRDKLKKATGNDSLKKFLEKDNDETDGVGIPKDCPIPDVNEPKIPDFKFDPKKTHNAPRRHWIP